MYFGSAICSNFVTVYPQLVILQLPSHFFCKKLRFFQYCLPAQNQPKSLYLFQKNCSPCDFCIMAMSVIADEKTIFCSSFEYLVFQFSHSQLSGVSRISFQLFNFLSYNISMYETWRYCIHQNFHLTSEICPFSDRIAFFQLPPPPPFFRFWQII